MSPFLRHTAYIRINAGTNAQRGCLPFQCPKLLLNLGSGGVNRSADAPETGNLQIHQESSALMTNANLRRPQASPGAAEGAPTPERPPEGGLLEHTRITPPQPHGVRWKGRLKVPFSGGGGENEYAYLSGTRCRAGAFINGSSFILCIFSSFLLNLNKPINGD